MLEYAACAALLPAIIGKPVSGFPYSICCISWPLLGFCGALTTYSTFGFETVRLAEGGSTLYAFANIAVSLAAGLAAAWLGLAIAGVLWG